ncbi:hypothetical protein NF212_21750 [Parasalinivibrio latis]|uniref:hypothetical protein n=1 Tax=Parasalinivibrio latis TaxID=2952610 RepID=UPI0030DF1768
MTISPCIVQRDIARYLVIQAQLDARLDALDQLVDDIADTLLQRRTYQWGNHTVDFDDVIVRAIEHDAFTKVCSLALENDKAAVTQLKTLLTAAAFALAEHIAEDALQACLSQYTDEMEER